MNAPMLLAPESAVSRAFKAEADFWHGEWRCHTSCCRKCRVGAFCRMASYLADRADSYGKKVMLAERRERARGGRR